MVFRPFRGSIVYPMLPTAYAVGYNISPLPGLVPGTGKPKVANSIGICEPLTRNPNLPVQETNPIFPE